MKIEFSEQQLETIQSALSYWSSDSPLNASECVALGNVIHGVIEDAARKTKPPLGEIRYGKPDTFLDEHMQMYRDWQKKMPTLLRDSEWNDTLKTRLQPIRDEIFQTVHKQFYRLDHVVLTFDQFKIHTEDQGGWPFVALSMEMRTGHSTEVFYAMVLNAVKMMIGNGK